jgi:hypothetical protein
LAAPKAFLIRAIRFYIKFRPFLATAPAGGNAQVGAFDDCVQIINTGVFQLTIGNKVYNLEPLWCLTAGAGAFGILTEASTTLTASYAQNGIPDPRAVNTLSKPLFIGPQINFTARIDWPVTITLSAGNPTLCILLDGDLLRPVQ